MTDLFRKIAMRVAEKLGFAYPFEDDKNVMVHLHHVRNLPQEAKVMY